MLMLCRQRESGKSKILLTAPAMVVSYFLPTHTMLPSEGARLGIELFTLVYGMYLELLIEWMDEPNADTQDTLKSGT